MRSGFLNLLPLFGEISSYPPYPDWITGLQENALVEHDDRQKFCLRIEYRQIGNRLAMKMPLYSRPGLVLTDKGKRRYNREAMEVYQDE